MHRGDRRMFGIALAFVAVLYGWLLVLEVEPLIAQDEAGCSVEQVTAAVEVLQAALDEATALLEGGDAAGAMEQLQATTNAIAAVRALCDGLTFEGEAGGQNSVVLGPVQFPDGIYRAIVTTDGYISMTIEALSGDCDPGAAMFLGEGDATEGAETVFRPEGCTALIEVSNLTASWELRFERLTVSS